MGILVSHNVTATKLEQGYKSNVTTYCKDNIFVNENSSETSQELGSPITFHKKVRRYE